MMLTRKNDAVLDLPKVNSIWLGGLWLRGIFNGGIFANGFWNSVKCEESSSGLVYEERIGSTYDETYSLFKQGQMMNSVWEGGIVDDEGDNAVEKHYHELQFYKDGVKTLLVM